MHALQVLLGGISGAACANHQFMVSAQHLPGFAPAPLLPTSFLHNKQSPVWEANSHCLRLIAKLPR